MIVSAFMQLNSVSSSAFSRPNSKGNNMNILDQEYFDKNPAVFFSLSVIPSGAIQDLAAYRNSKFYINYRDASATSSRLHICPFN